MAEEENRRAGNGADENPSDHTSRRKRAAGPAEMRPRRTLREPAINAIQANRKPKKARNPMRAAATAVEATPTPATSSPVQRADTDPWTVPQSVRDRFVQDGHRFYFPDGAPAFKDLGRKLTTGSDNTQVVRSLIEIAHSRGWTEVTVTGTERFRQEAWRQARLEGLAVRGYRPSEVEQAQLVRALARTLARPGAREDAVSAGRGPATDPLREEGGNAGIAAGTRAPERIAGRLVDHGRDHYRHDPDQAMSYFVRLATDRGSREIWGKDIERAVTRSLSQAKIGDEVVLQRNGRTPVTVRRMERSHNGGVIERPVETFRNQWTIEKQEFLTARAQTAQVVRDAAIEPKEAVRQHPELAGTYVALRAAALAARSLRDSRDQARFVSRVREALADGIQSGEPLITVRVRDGRQAHSAPSRSAEPRESSR